MKKFIVLLLAAVLLLPLTIAGCGNSIDSDEATSGHRDDFIKNTESSGETESDNSNFDQGAKKKTLVVYYSATGTTERVAKSIANLTDADTFIIEPEIEYSSEDLDWTDKNSRVSIEHDNPENRDVKLKAVNPDNFENYDCIFIGYPIWWGIAAWPVDSFVKENNFTGKTVVPFCTSASSNIGESGKLIAEASGTGEWKDGKRFDGNFSDEEIREWLDSLNLK